MDIPWLWAGSTVLSYGTIWCWTCRSTRGDAVLTPYGLMCWSCHAKVAATRTVHLTWDTSNNSAKVSWDGVGEAALFYDALLRNWVVSGHDMTVRGNDWHVAVFNWAVMVCYEGRDPFTRHDWAAYVVPDTPPEDMSTAVLQAAELS